MTCPQPKALDPRPPLLYQSLCQKGAQHYLFQEAIPTALHRPWEPSVRTDGTLPTDTLSPTPPGAALPKGTPHQREHP